MKDARQSGSAPSDDRHLPDPGAELPAGPPPHERDPRPETSASGTGDAPNDTGSTTLADADTATNAPEPPSPPGLDDRERRLAPQVVTAWRIGSVGSLILPTLVLTTLAFFFLDGWGWVVLGALIALALVLTLWYAPARYKRWRWQLTDLAIELRFGVVVRQQETVPYFRIQQIDIVQGPLDRILDLATLQVTTASASGSASLPGIANDDAPAVRAELLARAAAAVAEHPGDLRDAV